MIDEISDYYARKRAVVVTSESSQLVLAQFSPLDSAQDFFVVENKLKRLSSVASLDILKVQGTKRPLTCIYWPVWKSSLMKWYAWGRQY